MAVVTVTTNIFYQTSSYAFKELKVAKIQNRS